MRAGIVIFPGSNCDYDTFHVLKNIVGSETHFIWHKDTKIAKYDLIVLPGGFSYGDYLRAGAIAKFSPVMKEIKAFAKDGGVVLGICNGFQVLLEVGLLSGAMLVNKNIHFVCKFVNVRVKNTKTPFTNLLKDGEVLRIPIAHKEGNYFADTETIKKIKEENRIVFQYSSAEGEVKEEYNPNGSILNIAGIVNEEGNVLGMMPHPERASEKILGSDDGLKIFLSIKRYIEELR